MQVNVCTYDENRPGCDLCTGDADKIVVDEAGTLSLCNYDYGAYIAERALKGPRVKACRGLCPRYSDEVFECDCERIEARKVIEDLIYD